MTILKSVKKKCTFKMLWIAFIVNCCFFVLFFTRCIKTIVLCLSLVRLPFNTLHPGYEKKCFSLITNWLNLKNTLHKFISTLIIVFVWLLCFVHNSACGTETIIFLADYSMCFSIRNVTETSYEWNAVIWYVFSFVN